MKFRIILTILLSSFVLNIFHDLLITHHTSLATSQVMVMEEFSEELLGELLGEHQTHHRLCDLHKMFHFSAILLSKERLEYALSLSSTLLFIEKISPRQLFDTSFKPPKA